MRKRILLMTLLLVLASTTSAAAQNWLARLTINDTYLSGQLLFSDGKGTYIDHRLDGGDPCVTAWVKKDGFFFIYMNYTAEFGNDCNQYIDPTLWRTFILKFPATSGICSALGLPVDGSGLCELTGRPNPRIRAEKLFARAQETTVAFMFYLNGHSYSLEPNKGVPISGTGDTRTLTYYDTATLKEVFAPPQRPRAVGSSFIFPFQLTVERVQQ